jgi:hypothetical protein
MSLQVYIYDEVDSFKFDIWEENSNTEIYNATEFLEEIFISKHRTNLFKQQHSIAFYNVDKVSQGTLLGMVGRVDTSIIWGFKKLAKSSKLYKKLIDSTEIKQAHTLKDTKERVSFIKALVHKYKLPTDLVGTLVLNTTNDKFVIKAEIEKIKLAEKQGQKELEEILSKYTSEEDIFNFIMALFTDYTKAFNLIKSVCTQETEYTTSEFMHNLLLKKIKSYIFLAMNRPETACEFWNTPGYYLYKETDIAEGIGKDTLFGLYKLCTELFRYTAQCHAIPLELKLKKILYYLYNKETNESYSSRI